MFLRVEFRTYCHATEDLEKVKTAMRFLTGVAAMEERKAEGHYGNPIIVLESTLRDRASIKDFWTRVYESGELMRISKGLESRIDADCFLHVRFDKQMAYKGTMVVADHDDVITLRAKVGSFPAKRERALSVARDYFTRLGV